MNSLVMCTQPLHKRSNARQRRPVYYELWSDVAHFSLSTSASTIHITYIAIITIAASIHPMLFCGHVYSNILSDQSRAVLTVFICKEADNFWLICKPNTRYMQCKFLITVDSRMLSILLMLVSGGLFSRSPRLGNGHLKDFSSQHRCQDSQ